MDMLINLTVEIIPQYMSNHHLAHFKYLQLYFLIIS